jgi:hypothetical protein
VGIISICELILERQPQATCVINSLVPGGKDELFKEEYYKAISEARRCYAGDTHKVEIFDTTDIFLKNSKR